MSRPVARGPLKDKVLSRTGSGKFCTKPLITATFICSTNVFANEKGVVRKGDLVKPHPKPKCKPDLSTVSIASNSVFANNKGVARIGDLYGPDNIILSGSNNVFSG